MWETAWPPEHFVWFRGTLARVTDRWHRLGEYVCAVKCPTQMYGSDIVPTTQVNRVVISFAGPVVLEEHP